MKFAIIGYGKMGHAIEQLALQRGHSVACVIDADEQWAYLESKLHECDVAVEFTMPSVAARNVSRLLHLGLPTVCGTTGWQGQFDAVATLCKELDGALFTASNFSVGMNMMFLLNERLAQLMVGRTEYKADITEVHHVHKLDAPSGTALVLQQGIRDYLPEQPVPITSVREGEVPGIHTVRYACEDDTITLSHEAHSRRSLAMGAVLAAEFLVGRRGLFTMRDLLAC